MTEYILIYLAGCLAVYLLMCKFADEPENWYRFFVAIGVIWGSWASFILSIMILWGMGEFKIKIKPPKPPKIFFRFKNNKPQ